MILRLLLAFLPGLARAASGGYGLDLPEKSPLFLKVLDQQDAAEPMGLREPLLYFGYSLTWRPSSKTADIEKGGAKATLVLEDPWVYLDKKRARLSSPLHWKEGRLVLPKKAMEELLKALDPALPGFRPLNPEELLAFPTPAPAQALPTVVASGEPEIVSPEERVSAAKPSRGPLRRVVIDAGHGGHDPGARGRSGFEEKEVCLDIALRVKRLVEDSLPGVDVLLTRSTDRFVSLKDRTVMANEADSDIFISIHNNASTDRQSRGSQVFFFDSRASDRAAEDLARRENEDANYLEILMTDLAKSLVRDQSIRLAQLVQDELQADTSLKRRRLSYAPFYVLARTKMPAILVEVAFISNPREEQLLGSSSFRQQVAESVAKGIRNYSGEAQNAMKGARGRKRSG